MLQKALSNERDVIKKIGHGFGQKQYGYRCGFLAWQSPGGSAVAMFKTFLFICDFLIVIQIPNMDTKYVQMMRSFSEHPKCYKMLSLMKER